MVVGVELATDKIARFKLDKLVRPGTDWPQVVRGVARPGTRVVGKQMFWNDGAELADKGIGPKRGWFVEQDAYGKIVDLLNRNSRTVPIVTAAVAGSLANSQLNTTSSAVKGFPSCHLTPGLSFHVTDLPSGDKPRFGIDGITVRVGGDCLRLPSLRAVHRTAESPHGP